MSSSHHDEPERKRRKLAEDSDSTTDGDLDDSGDESEAQVIRVHIVPAKIEEEDMMELIGLVEGYHIEHTADASVEFVLKLAAKPQDADVIVTATHMKRRFERHVDWAIAKRKAVVTPEWLRQVAKQRQLQPCGNYAALVELEETTEDNCPVNPDNPPTIGSRWSEPVQLVQEFPDDLAVSHAARYACMRNAPLICPNQDLVNRLAIIQQCRELEGQDMQALAYSRILAVLKAFPHKIKDRNVEEVSNLPYVGPKSISKIKEYLDTGDISETLDILSNPRLRCLRLFVSIYGIGPTTARQLYMDGMRTINDLEKRYHVHGSDTEAETTQILKNKPNKLPDLSIKVGLKLREDFSLKIPREEVEELRDVVMRELEGIRPGHISTITGGYRRGKQYSNDVDIVISHSDWKRGRSYVAGLSKVLLQQLFDRGVVTHVMHLSGFHARDAMRTSHWDSLEKALTVFQLPGNPHRRVDLIFAAPEVYWTAVLGWTGSKMFERDLRLYAKQEKAMKFDSSGITRRHDCKEYHFRSERDIFHFFGLPWIDPTMRNA